MKKGQILEGYIERVDFPNKGILRAEDGTRVIVKNAIMGQKVSAAGNKVRKGKCEGRLLEKVRQRDGFWKFWSIHRKNVSRHVRILEFVADALIRICRMKSRWR